MTTINLRCCISCRRQLHKDLLIRFVKVAEQIVLADATTNKQLQGRSAYLCLNKQCWQKCWQRQLLDKQLRSRAGSFDYTVPPTEYLQAWS